VVFGWLHVRGIAKRVLGATTVQWLLDHRTVRRDNIDAHIVKGDPVAGIGDGPLVLRDFEIRVVSSAAVGVLFPLRIHLAVIEKAIEVGDGIRRRRAADMIAVVVSREQIVDLRQPGRLHRVGNALRIAFGRRARAAAVDQHRAA
jgi:hypothetical protein